MGKKTALKKLGWTPDQRDLLYSASLARFCKVPEQVHLRKGCPPVYDQGEIGSCAANAIAAARNFWDKKAGGKGHFYMLYAYLLDSPLARDFWTVRSVAG